MNARILLTSLLLPAALAMPSAAQSAVDPNRPDTHQPYTGEQARILRSEREKAAALVMDALDSGADRAGLLAAAERAATGLAGAPAALTRLEEAIAATRAGAETVDLERALERIVDDLRFRPYVEAELPLGWPDAAPVGELVLKSYPRYRMAKTEMRSRGGMNTPFFALFNHIKRNDIAMTAPVQMDYPEGRSSSRATATMAFLYSHPNMGETGADGRDQRVEVVDVAPLTTISIGARGYESPQRTAEMNARLQAWLEAHAGEFEAAGPMRTMGYNSPMVPSARRFFEVELPVRRIEASND